MNDLPRRQLATALNIYRGIDTVCALDFALVSPTAGAADLHALSGLLAAGHVEAWRSAPFLSGNRESVLATAAFSPRQIEPAHLQNVMNPSVSLVCSDELDHYLDTILDSGELGEEALQGLHDCLDQMLGGLRHATELPLPLGRHEKVAEYKAARAKFVAPSLEALDSISLFTYLASAENVDEAMLGVARSMLEPVYLEGLIGQTLTWSSLNSNSTFLVFP